MISADSYYSKDEMEFIKKKLSDGETYNTIARELYKNLKIYRTKNGIRKHVCRHKDFYEKNIVNSNPMEYQIDKDIALIKIQRDKRSVEDKYKLLLNRLDKTEIERDALLSLSKNLDTFKITTSNVGRSEATAFLVASDWHVAEVVDPNKVNGLNEYNLDVAKERAEAFFRNGLRLIKIQQKDVTINTVVLALLGDFVSGNIHNELMENNSLLPIEEAIFAQNLLVSGIEYLLEDSSIKELVVPCHSGNHGRITIDRRVTTEAGNNLEYFIYHQLSNHFKNNKRVKFVISEGYHSYIDVYNYCVRFHHGHNLSFYGGSSGLFLPVQKSISQWNKLKKADFDVLGHFHQMLDGGNFISNGSNIGYNAYALSIKASYEQPKQAFFLIDKNRGKTIVAPILLSE